MLLQSHLRVKIHMASLAIEMLEIMSPRLVSEHFRFHTKTFPAFAAFEESLALLLLLLLMNHLTVTCECCQEVKFLGADAAFVVDLVDSGTVLVERFLVWTQPVAVGAWQHDGRKVLKTEQTMDFDCDLDGPKRSYLGLKDVKVKELDVNKDLGTPNFYLMRVCFCNPHLIGSEARNRPLRLFSFVNEVWI